MARKKTQPAPDAPEREVRRVESDAPSRGKRELGTREERTIPGRFYAPATDIYETGEALIVVMDMPGVNKESVEVRLEKDLLSVEGRIDYKNYEGLTPVYTEYNVGHFSRRFSLTEKVDRDAISARINDGVLTLTLPKVAQARRRRVPVS